MLTERAQKYLAGLERLTPVPTAEVERVLKAQGSPCFPAWLGFHDTYAGYVEPIGLERAVFGLVHAQSKWIQPMKAAVTRSYQPEAEWFITCAEVHPSYTFELGDEGFFKEPAAANFEIRLERSALRVEFLRRPGAKPVLTPDPSLDALAAAATAVLEASDAHFEAVVGPRFFGLRETSSGRWIDRATCG